MVINIKWSECPMKYTVTCTKPTCKLSGSTFNKAIQSYAVDWLLHLKL